MSLFRHINKFFIILFVIILANAESDLPDNERTTTISSMDETVEGSTEVASNELTADMKRNQRSFLGNLLGDIFDDCDCNNCNCNPAPIQNNIQPDYNYNYNYDNRPRDNIFHGKPVFKPWKPLKVLKKPWFGLFGNGCGGNCNNNQVHYHHGYNNNNGYNNNDGYNYNPAPAPQKYDQPPPVYEKPKFEEHAAIFEKPKYEEPAPVYEQPKYEEPAPVYEEPKYEEPAFEKPATVYKRPIYEAPEKSNCDSNYCPPQPQLVYQPIIYLGPAQAQVNENSSEEEKESKVEVPEQYEEYKEYEEKNESKSSHEDKKTFEKKEYEKNSSEEEKENKKEDHKSNTLIPVVPVYSPCSHGCGAPSPYSSPPLNYAAPQNVPLHQVINYNGIVPNHAPTTPIYAGDYYPYVSGAYSPAPVTPGCGCGHQSYSPVYNYPVAPSHSSFSSYSLPHSHGSVPTHSQSYLNHYHQSADHHAANNHGTHHYYPSGNYIHKHPVLTPHDQPYRACPELFAAYNEHIGHLTSTNIL